MTAVLFQEPPFSKVGGSSGLLFDNFRSITRLMTVYDNDDDIFVLLHALGVVEGVLYM